jgi:hypothetical protein
MSQVSLRSAGRRYEAGSINFEQTLVYFASNVDRRLLHRLWILFGAVEPGCFQSAAHAPARILSTDTGTQREGDNSSSLPLLTAAASGSESCHSELVQATWFARFQDVFLKHCNDQAKNNSPLQFGNYSAISFAIPICTQRRFYFRLTK